MICFPLMTYTSGANIFCDMGGSEEIRHRLSRWNTIGWWELVCTDRTEWCSTGWKAPFCG